MQELNNQEETQGQGQTNLTADRDLLEVPEEFRSGVEPESLPVNRAFSTSNPLMQLIWDATSLGTFRECPKKYYLQVIRGYTTKRAALALDFGIALHEGLELYYRNKAKGMPQEENERAVVALLLRHPLRANIDKYEDPVRNSKTLVFSVWDYMQNYRHEPCETMVFSDGTVGVELHFQFETDFQTALGEKISLAGHIDRLTKQDLGVFVQDHKTTSMPLTQRYFDQYKPDTQMTLYTIAGDVVFATPIKGVMIDGIDLKKGEFSRQMSLRSREYCEEWLGELELWLKVAEFYATRGIYPGNDKSCHKYSGCPFKDYCTAPQNLREQILQEDFVKRVWDPSQPRGD